ncbi:MAG: hypothetical protein JXB47_07100 [Anaerolineae bacterium]|nr:hypothetical protein [Anaerolineae bacterium]
MLGEVVIDANVWVVADYDIVSLDDIELLICASACRQRLECLRSDTQLLIVDDKYHIMSEYRRYVSNKRKPHFENNLASELLNELEQRGRIFPVPVDFDADGYALLPPELGLQNFDPSDRKFVAVALARNPRSPIYNATDPDWSEHVEAIAAAGLTVIELCPECITL